MAEILVDGLSKSFVVREKAGGLTGGFRALFNPASKTVEAVKNVCFQVEGGETLAFIGPNGAGKSTTIKMLTGILYPDGGTASVLGMVPWKDRRLLAYHVGSVFGQKSQLWYHLPPIDSYRLLSKIYELRESDYRSRLKELAETFDLGELMGTPVRKMSLGQRMRCEIAGSLLHRPRVIFLDEPTIGLDVVAKQKIRELIRRLNKEEGLTVFLTSHDAGDIEQLCKRVIVINHGVIILDTEVAVLKRDYLQRKVVGMRLETPVDMSRATAIPGVTVAKSSGQGLKVNIDTKVADVSDALSSIMKLGRIEDINISDPPLEEIISDIYQGERGDGPWPSGAKSQDLQA